MLRRLALATAAAGGRLASPPGGWAAAAVAAGEGRAAASAAASPAPSRPALLSARRGSAASASSTPAPASTPMPAFVFLGAPGVGKGTYSVRVAAALGAAHVSAGDLVRSEIRAGTALGKEMAATVARGDLLPDSTVAALVSARLASEAAAGAAAAVLDGYPRTAAQAADLLADGTGTVAVAGALNLTLREQALIDKCLGRRTCSKCGSGFNVADIWLPATPDGRPAVVMPPLTPPPECAHWMEVRADDNPATVRNRLAVYAREAAPVEAAFEQAGLLARLELTGGIKESLPAVLEAVRAAGGAKVDALLAARAKAVAAAGGEAPAKAKGGCGLAKKAAVGGDGGGGAGGGSAEAAAPAAA